MAHPVCSDVHNGQALPCTHWRLQVLKAMASLVHKLHQMPGLQQALKDFDLHSLLLADSVKNYTSQGVAGDLTGVWLAAMQRILEHVAPVTDTPLLQDLLQLYGQEVLPKSAWVSLVNAALSSTPRTLQLWLESPFANEVSCAYMSACQMPLHGYLSNA